MLCIHGESGTGKELVAKAVHAYSAHSAEPFEAINCAAIPTELVESELFGHEKVSFSGAVSEHLGIFERVGGGTLLLDEITEMPNTIQVKLLRVLESGQFRRVGGKYGRSSTGAGSVELDSPKVTPVAIPIWPWPPGLPLRAHAKGLKEAQ